MGFCKFKYKLYLALMMPTLSIRNVKETLKVR